MRSELRTRRVASVSLALALASSIFLQAGASFAQTDEEKAAARALATQGAEELKQNHYAQALDLVTRAQQIVHAPTHLLMIARAQVGLGKLVAAQETYLKLTREDLAPNAPTAFKNAQVAARDELAAIEPKIGSLRIALDGVGQKSVTVKLDDQPVPAALLGVYRPIDPGPHVIGVFPAGQSPIKGMVDVHEGEKKELKLTVPDAPGPGVPVNAADNPDANKVLAAQPPRDSAGPGFFTPLRIVGLVAGVAGIGLIGGGGAMFAKGASTASQANKLAVSFGCLPSDPTSCNGLSMTQKNEITTQVTPLDNTAASQKTIGGALVGVGAAALVTGVVLIVVGKPKPAAAHTGGPARPVVEPWFAGTSGGLLGSF